MTLPIATLVLRGSVEQQMIRMDVDLDPPADRWDSQVETNFGTIRQIEISELWLHGYAPTS